MSDMRHDLASSVSTERARYSVIPSVFDGDLGPVALSVGTGVAHMQDYLTPEEAEALAAALVEGARHARSLNSEPVAS